jgi:uncharacterized protein YcbK (DUF882 family)
MVYEGLAAMRRCLSLASLAVIAAAVAVPLVARADVQHTIGKGHTIEAIANRYHVTKQSIIDANHLKDVKHLKVGDVLTIPKVDPPPGSKAKTDAKAKDKDKDKDGHHHGDAKAKLAAKPSETDRAATPTTFAMKAKTPGIVHVKRAAEDVDIKITDSHGKVAEGTLKSFEKLMRSPNGLSHPIDGRLISLLGVVSNHFGSRKIEIVSGFRPYTPTQYTPHSNHNHGKAIDFRIPGVPNESVRDFCRTLKNVGCGYYPNSTFVHLDVRDKDAFWIDYSKPGEPPRYNSPNVDADEGTSDVHSGPPAQDKDGPAGAESSEKGTPPGSSGGTAPDSPSNDAPAPKSD